MPPVLPAEWAPQQAVLLTWPRPDGSFARMFAAVEKCFIEIAGHIARHQDLWISTAGDAEALRAQLQAVGIAPERLRVCQQANDDVWVRDHGPITVRDTEGQLQHLDFRFNGWGGKHAAERDNLVSAGLAAAGLLPAKLTSLPFILEGGAIESDGAGTLLTTERCVLSGTRNGGSRKAFEAYVATHMGFDRVLWLEHGGLAGDDTDGHIDTLARFVDTRSIVFQACEDTDDEHFQPLAAMHAELRAMRTADGQPYRLHALPLPGAIYDGKGQRLPASYANFLIINSAVLVPTYRDASDARALAILAECFPDHRIIGIDCVPLIHQYGSLHCVTMQIPAAA